MSENDFSGSIPTEISELVSLELLSLSSDSSSLTGTLPSEVGLLSSLRKYSAWNDRETSCL